MEKLRGDKKFLDFCCKDYSVAKNVRTGEMTVILGKFGTAGFDWEPVKSGLCCEEAEAIAGKPGVCSGTYGGGNTGNNGCAKDYSVWENTQTGKMSVVLGKFGTAGFGWRFVKGDLCCKEAEDLAGIPGACSGSTRDGNTGNTGCAKDFYVYEDTRTGKRYVTTGRFTTPEMRLVKRDLCCKEAEDLAGTPGACSGKTSGGTTSGETGYIGYYKDTSDFDLNGFLERSQSNTPQRCDETCRAKGFAYAAVQYGESCLCGNSYGKYGQADNCDYKCTGDGGKICGGYSANSVYGTGAGDPQAK